MRQVQDTLADIVMLAKQLSDMEAIVKARKMGSVTFEQLELERSDNADMLARSDNSLTRLRVLREKQFALSVMLMGVLLVSSVVLFVHIQMSWLGWIVNLCLAGAVIIASIVITYVISPNTLMVFKEEVGDEEDPLAKSFKVTMPFIIFAGVLLASASLLAGLVWLGSRTPSKTKDEAEEEAKTN